MRKLLYLFALVAFTGITTGCSTDSSNDATPVYVDPAASGNVEGDGTPM